MTIFSNFKYIKFFTAIFLLLAFFCLKMPVYAQSPIPGINISVNTATTPQQVSTTLQIVFLLTILTLAPAILIMTTSFTRFVIVLSFLRQAIGTPQAPSNQIVIGIALFLSLFVEAIARHWKTLVFLFVGGTCVLEIGKAILEPF